MFVQKDTKSTRSLSSLRTQKAANILFTKKQMDIIAKVMALEKLDRREGEIYSRTVKPRLDAIIDFYYIAITAREKE